MVVSHEQTELTWHGISFPEGGKFLGCNAAAAVSQRHQGVRGRGAKRKLRRRGSGAQRISGGGQPGGASFGAAGPRRPFPGPVAKTGEDNPPPRLPKRGAPDACCPGQ